METKVGVGQSKRDDPFEAGAEAARVALDNAGINKCDFVFAFATADYDHNKLLQGIRSVTGDAPLSGCSAFGVITQEGPCGEGDYTESGLIKGQNIVGVMVFSSTKIRFHNLYAEGLLNNSEKTGEEIGKKIHHLDVDPLFLIMLPDGLSFNSNAFFMGIDKQLKKPLLFSGGGASECLDKYKTYQFHNDKVLSDSISCVLISGEVNIETAISHGSVPISTEKAITKAEANRIYEIDHEPTWSFYKSYLPDDADNYTAELAASLCLLEKLPEKYATEYDTHIARNALSKYPDDSLLFGTEITTGAKIQMGRRDPDKISMNAGIMTERIKSKLGKRKPIAVLHFDCAARGKLCFGNEAKEKGIDVIQDLLGKDIPWLGLYSYGEIGPISGKNYFHNGTVSLCIFY